MEVELLSYTPEPERAIAVAARLCYSPLDATKLKANFTEEQACEFVEKLADLGHMSAFEHATFTFGVAGISRACTHQLVRHRLASYNQQSQRYVKFGEGLDVVIPPEISKNKDAVATFLSARYECYQAYKKLLDCGIKAEDARYILPNAASSNIVITMNARELLHFFSLRCCNRAQWEIRSLAWHMLKLCKEVAPTVFKNAGPGCVRGTCPEGEMCCKHPYSTISLDMPEDFVYVENGHITGAKIWGLEMKVDKNVHED